MKRREFLKSFGAVGLAGMVPAGPIFAADSDDPRLARANCWLTTSLAEGPFYFNTDLLRQDIRTDSDTGELHDGAPLTMNFTVINADCQPIPGVLVDVWHCDADGLYSGYIQAEGNTQGQDFMRGFQDTDQDGQCSFLTSYPSWYPGRATHVHFKVRLDAFNYVTSQFAYPEDISDLVHTTPRYADRGINSTRNSTDGIFRNEDLTHLIMDVTPNGDGSYVGNFTIGIDAQVSAVDDQLPGPHSLLGQNFPNPFNPRTTIPYFLPSGSHVDLKVFDARGRMVADLVSAHRESGHHEAAFDGRELPSGFYFYRMAAAGQKLSRQMLLIK